MKMIKPLTLAVIFFALKLVTSYKFLYSKVLWGGIVKSIAQSHGDRIQTLLAVNRQSDVSRIPQKLTTLPQRKTSPTPSSESYSLSVKEFQEMQNIFSKNKAVMGLMKSTAASNKPISSPTSIKRVIDTIPKDEVNSIKKMLEHNKMLMNNNQNEENKKKKNKSYITTSDNTIIHDKAVLNEINKVKESIPIPSNLTEEEETARIFERNRVLIEYINQEIIKINEAFLKKKQKNSIKIPNYLTLSDYHKNNQVRYSKNRGKHLPSPIYQRHEDITYNREALLHFLQIFENKNPMILTDLSKDNEIVYRGALDESSYRYKESDDDDTDGDDHHRVYMVHIDLHGLPLVPALQIVRSSIYYYSEEFTNRNVDYIVLKFIVGVGKHSADRQPVLGPQIGRLLKQDYYHDILTNRGEIIVRIEN